MILVIDLNMRCFDSIKKCISEAVLILPKPDECLCLRTDASNEGISAILEITAGKPVYFC